MKSERLGRSLNLIAVFLMAVMLVFSGCSSAGISGFENSSVNLLGGKNSVYISVPVTEYPELTEKILRKKAGLSEKNASMVVSRLTKLYAGINVSSGDLDMAAEGNFPSSLAGLVLTKKNGWTKKIHEVEINSGEKTKCLKYKYFDGGKYGIAFLSGSRVLVSNSVTQMLDRYQLDEKSGPQFDFLENGENVESDILFYIAEPGKLLSDFLNPTMQAWFSSGYGNISKAESDGEYLLTLNLVISNPNIKKAVVPMMKLAGLDVVSSSENELTISELKCTTDEILDFMSGGSK